jgi:hypothetical protein
VYSREKSICCTSFGLFSVHPLIVLKQGGHNLRFVLYGNKGHTIFNL